MKSGPHPQLDLFLPKQPAGRIVLAVETNLGPFGNRTDVMVVDKRTVRGLSLLECDNPFVHHSDNLQLPTEEDIMTDFTAPPPDDKTLGPLDDGKPKV